MYPKMVFKCPGVHSLAGGKSYDHELVHSDEEAREAAKQGWFLTVPEALNGVATLIPAAVEEVPLNLDAEIFEEDKSLENLDTENSDAPPTRDELEAKATELGIKFSKKTTYDQLSAAITVELAK